MNVAFLDLTALIERVLAYASTNLRIERILIQLGLDPSNLTYDVLSERVLDIALENITFANVFALIGGVFLISTFVVRTIVPMRVLCIVSIVFFLGSAGLAGSVPKFFLYLLALPINVVRLVQIRRLIQKARNSAQGTLSLSWLRPFMTPRSYNKGDVLFRKGDPATEMFLTVTGKFLVTEISIEILPDRILGELGFLTPNNHRTQSVECTEDGEVLAIAYDKLLEIYFQNPEFGYYFLRLTSDRLLQNFARLEGLVEEGRVAIAAAEAERAPADTDNKSRAGKAGKKPVGATGRSPEGGAKRRRLASGAARRSLFVGNILAIMTKQKPAPSERLRPSPVSDEADRKAADQCIRALAIVERHANYAGASGFIPLPLVNIAAIVAVLVRMVRELSKLYGVPFEHNRAHSLAIGLIGGVMPGRLGAVVSVTVGAVVPGANLVGLAISSVGASAYARRIGWMMIEQLEHEAARDRERQAVQNVRHWRSIWPIRLATEDRAGRSEWMHNIRGGWLRR
jgi:CRP-like cAMP-binding protein/uncharacterized protein (DUF697 family)